MQLTSHDRLFVLTGAGISAESGLATFRGSGGLWSGHRVEEVATPEAWQTNPAFVWSFYSARRRNALAAEPNPGHFALARVEQHLAADDPTRFYLCTQNVDDLHERAGSSRVHHMHGSLFQSRCIRCDQPFPDRTFYETAPLPTCPDCGSLIRPHIVWFGEIPLDMDSIYAELARASIFLVVGTSGSVYPAAGLVHIAQQHGIRTIYVGPEEPSNAASFDQILLGTAVETLPTLFDRSV
jgi:NAD-dependent deacetylase